MKRARDTETFEPCKRQYFVRPNHKRKRDDSHSSSKRVRTDEAEALHRMLIEAYARIKQLELELKHAKIVEYCKRMGYHGYNHSIKCH